MPTAVRVPLSFLLTMVMAVVAGLTLAKPAAAVIPQTPYNVLATTEGPPPPSTTDVLVWVGVDGPEEGDRLVIDQGLLNSTTFGYRNGRNQAGDGLTFPEAVGYCEADQAACSAQVGKNLKDAQLELNDAFNKITTQCVTPNSRGLRGIRDDSSTMRDIRISLVRAGVVSVIAGGAVYGGNAVIGLELDKVGKLTGLIAAGSFLASIAGDYSGEVAQQNVGAAATVAMMAVYNTMRQVAKQIRQATAATGTLTAQGCTQLAQYLRGVEGGAQPEPGRTEIPIAEAV